MRKHRKCGPELFSFFISSYWPVQNKEKEIDNWPVYEEMSKKKKGKCGFAKRRISSATAFHTVWTRRKRNEVHFSLRSPHCVLFLSRPHESTTVVTATSCRPGNRKSKRQERGAWKRKADHFVIDHRSLLRSR